MSPASRRSTPPSASSPRRSASSAEHWRELLVVLHQPRLQRRAHLAVPGTGLSDRPGVQGPDEDERIEIVPWPLDAARRGDRGSATDSKSLDRAAVAGRPARRSRPPVSIHEEAARGFERGADAYERGRPGYPPEAVQWPLQRARDRAWTDRARRRRRHREAHPRAAGERRHRDRGRAGRGDARRARARRAAAPGRSPEPRRRSRSATRPSTRSPRRRRFTGSTARRRPPSSIARCDLTGGSRCSGIAAGSSSRSIVRSTRSSARTAGGRRATIAGSGGRRSNRVACSWRPRSARSRSSRSSTRTGLSTDSARSASSRRCPRLSASRSSGDCGRWRRARSSRSGSGTRPSCTSTSGRRRTRCAGRSLGSSPRIPGHGNRACGRGRRRVTELDARLPRVPRARARPVAQHAGGLPLGSAAVRRVPRAARARSARGRDRRAVGVRHRAASGASGRPPAAPATLQRKIACLRSFYRHLRREGSSITTPPPSCAPRARRARLPKVLSRDEVNRLLEQPRGRPARRRCATGRCWRRCTRAGCGPRRRSASS